MSISYWVNFAWSAPYGEIAELLVSELGFDPYAPENDGSSSHPSIVRLLSDYFQISLSRSSADWREMIRDDVGAEVCTDLVFTINDEFTTQGEGGRALTRVVGLLLQRVKGDVVFLFEGEKVLLLRDASGTRIDPVAGFWNARNQETLASYVDFTEGPLPSL